jgi:hypothetical protein
MNRYEQSIFRPIFAIAAVAMTASVFGLAVFAPARMQAAELQPTASVAAPAAAAAAAAAVRPTEAEAAITTMRIDVVAVRERRTGFEPVRYTVPAHRQAG